MPNGVDVVTGRTDFLLAALKKDRAVRGTAQLPDWCPRCNGTTMPCACNRSVVGRVSVAQAGHAPGQGTVRLESDHPHPRSIVNAYIGPTVLVGPFCHIARCEIGAGAKIGPYTHIMADSVIGPGCRLEGCYIEGAKLGANVQVWRNAHLFRSFIGDGTIVGHGCFVAEGSRIGKDCRLMLNAGIGRVTTVGDGVYIGPNVVLSNSAPDGKLLPVLVGDRAWIGTNAVTTEGVHIGHDSVIGAGSVVTKEVEPFQIVVGNPARVVGDTRDK